MRAYFNQVSSMSAILFGQPGFFAPRMPPPQLQPRGAMAAISYYDTLPLKATLEDFVDFDLLNNGPVRFSVGAVNVRNGNFVYFDNRERRIRAEHIMASGALPPGFPPVEIDGEIYWDGGLVSNTPLSYVLMKGGEGNSLIFQVDLFSARGNRPRTIFEVGERQKDIQYSSRTRLNTDLYRHEHRLRAAIGYLLTKLPPEAMEDETVQHMAKMSTTSLVNIVHLVYRRKQYDQENKDYEFSRNSMMDHWRMGRDDMLRTFRHPEWLELPDVKEGVTTHDINRDAAD